MASAQQPVKRGGKAHFQFIDVAAFPRLEGEEPGRALIPQDIGQQPWPDYPTMWDVDRAYLTEHAIPQRCDVKRSATCLFSSYRSLDPMTDARTYNRAQARDYIAMRRADGVCDGTIRRELSIRQAALRHAVREERIAKAPIFPEIKGGPPRVRFLTTDEYRRLLQVPKPYRRQLFWLLAFETGARSAAIEELRWERVDMDNRVIDFRIPGRDHKNKRRAIAPINSRLYSRLAAALERRARLGSIDPFVIGAGGSTYNGCRADMETIGICERGIARHVARHTFCSWRMQAGFSAEIIGALIGDDPTMVRMVYGHLAPDHLRAVSEMDLSILRVERRVAA